MIFEGDYIEDRFKAIFDVRGFLHPPGAVIAYPKYVPSAQGERTREGRKYRRIYNLTERVRFLEENHPQYLRQDPYLGMVVPSIPLGEIVRVYKPREGFAKLKSSGKLSRLASKAVDLVRMLSYESSVDIGCFGISGSLLLGLEQPSSDIDINVYGYENCWRVYDTIATLRRRGKLQPLTYKMLEKIYRMRSAHRHVDFKEFCLSESKKLFQGAYQGFEYFIKFILEPPEYRWRYGMVKFKRLGKATVECTVTDDRYSIFTPGWATVESNHEEILEVAWYRGRFCGAARLNTKLQVRGILEEVETCRKSYKRIVAEHIKRRG